MDVLMEIRCRFYCRYVEGIAFVKYIIERGVGTKEDKCNKKYIVENEYEGYIKIISYMISKLDSLYIKEDYCKMTFYISNDEVLRDLTSQTEKDNLQMNTQSIFSPVFNFIKTNKVELKASVDFEKYKLNYIHPEYLYSNYEQLEKYNKELFDIVNVMIKKDFNYYKQKISRLDLASQDILHFIEVRELDNEKKSGYVDSIKKIRRLRRNLKNDSEIREYFRRHLTYIKGVLNTVIMTNYDISVPNTEEIDSYKLLFSTKDSREKLLNDL